MTVRDVCFSLLFFITGRGTFQLLKKSGNFYSQQLSRFHLCKYNDRGKFLLTSPSTFYHIISRICLQKEPCLLTLKLKELLKLSNISNLNTVFC